MSLRYPGGVITKTPTAPTTTAAVGVWTLDQAMQYQKAGTWPALVATDAKYNYVTSLLLGSGTSQVANTTVTDSSTNALPISRAGSPRQTSLTPYSQFDGAVQFNGSTDYLAIAQNAAFAPAGDFTIEGWFYFNSYSGAVQPAGNYTGNNSTDWLFEVGATGAVNFYTNGSTPRIQTAAGAVSLFTWVHLAMVRSSNVITGYVNGVSVGTYSQSGTFGSASKTIYLGTTGALGYKLNGQISNFRFVSGTAVYTNNFQPPITSLAAIANTASLTCQVSTASSNNAFASQGTVTTALTATGNPVQMPSSPFGMLIGSGAQYLNGSTDYLSAPNNSAFNLSASNFTIECWVYMNSISGYQRIIQYQNGSATNANYAYYFYLNGGTPQAGVIDGSTQYSASGPSNLIVGQWNHLAVTRSGTSLKVYVNGVGGTATTIPATFNNPASSVLYIGSDTTTAAFSGYISNLRIVKGTAIYTGTFKPPFAALTTDNSASSYPSTTNVTTGITASSTALLLNTADANFATATGASLNNNTFLDSGPYALPITRNGTPTQGSFSPFTPSGESWSTYFDNSGGGYIGVAFGNANSPILGTGAFTVECWVYPGKDDAGGICGDFTYPTNGNFFIRTEGTNNSLGIGYNGSAVIYTTPANALTVNKWQHVALSGNGTTARVFVDGVQVGTTFNYVPSSSSAARFVVGNVYDNTGGNGFTGYISNLRVVQSQLYTGTFTVPTSPLTNIANTTLLVMQNNRWVDNSNNNYAAAIVTGTPSIQRFQPFLSSASYSSSLVGGSYAWSGSSGSGLQITGDQRLTGDFTIEGWVYTTSGSATQTFYTIGSETTSRFVLYLYSSNVLYANIYGASNIALSGSYTVTANQWTHIAVTRVGSTTYAYFNGVFVGSSGSFTGTLGGSDYAQVGYSPSGGTLNGYLSNFRVVRGTALYATSSTAGTQIFIPPTSPEAVTSVPPTAQTSLALNFTNSAIADSSMVGDWVTLGSVQSSTATVNPFGSSGYTLKLPGASTDYMTQTIPSSGAHPSVFGAKEFTVECWIYMTTVGIRNSIYMQGSTGVGTYCAFECGINSSNKMALSLSTTGPSWAFADSGVGSTTLSANTWYHVAWVRSGSAITGYLNGVSQGTWAISAGTALYSAGTLNTIGTYYPSFGLFTGYISNLRITNGYARYTSNFSVPTTAFPTQGQLPAATPSMAVFTGSGTWTAPSGVTSVKAMVVAGGGGGGLDRGGGGGAGGLIYNPTLTVTPGSTYSVIVGAGGPANAGHGYPTPQTGSNSSFGGLVAYGGGVGGDVVNSSQKNGASGGSGGGGSHYNGAGTGGAATQISMNGGTGYGNAGGSGFESGSGGGGGGAGGVGAAASSGYGGNGGVGLDYSSVFGTGYGQSGYFAGGGGGGESGGTAPGNGGTGGGGRGGYQSTLNGAQNGQVNTGGGGGGAIGSYQTAAGYGGSGIVIISW